MKSFSILNIRGFFGLLCLALIFAVAPASGQTGSSLELEHWQAIKDSNDAILYRDHLQKFPDGTFSEIARQRLNNLTNGAPAKAAQSMSQWNGTYWMHTSFDHGGARCGLDGRGEVRVSDGSVKGYWTNGKAGGGLTGKISEAGMFDAEVKTGVVFVYIDGAIEDGIFQGEWETRGEVICGGRWTMTRLK